MNKHYDAYMCRISYTGFKIYDDQLNEFQVAIIDNKTFYQSGNGCLYSRNELVEKHPSVNAGSIAQIARGCAASFYKSREPVVDGWDLS